MIFERLKFSLPVFVTHNTVPHCLVEFSDKAKMDKCNKESAEPEPSVSGGNCAHVHKYSSVLSVFAIMLTVALFARNEGVIREMKMAEAELSEEIQQIKVILKQRAMYPVKVYKNEDGSRGKLLRNYENLVKHVQYAISVYCVIYLVQINCKAPLKGIPLNTKTTQGRRKLRFVCWIIVSSL